MRTTKTVFWRIHFKSDSQLAKSDLQSAKSDSQSAKSDSQSAKSNSQCQKKLANYFAKGIRNYPKSDSHLAMRYCLFLALHIHIHIHIHVYTVSKIVGLALQFATHSCLGCYSKLNFGSKFHAGVATYYLHMKLRTIYTLNIIL